MNLIENKTYDEERALYGQENLILRNCAFDGPADGESALKECRNIQLENTFCNLRYPFWHDHGLKLVNAELTELCRAALWYSDHIEASYCKFHGIKALRECADIKLTDCDIRSPEFGWSVKNLDVRDCTAESEYFLMRGENMTFSNLQFKGKYSFQYTKNITIENCYLDTKDAFWHAENVTVKNSVVKGEYLAWYSEGLTFVNCKIIGTQPLCYCRRLKLIDCEMIDTDLSFEKSQVEATLTAPILSIKNPLSGTITVPEVGEIIMDDPMAQGIVKIAANV